MAWRLWHYVFMKAIQTISQAEAAAVRFVLMDIDDTLTKDGKLGDRSYAALWELKKAGLVVIPVTGRPAGWCDLIARQWPVDAVIGENGALVFWEEAGPGRLPVLKQYFHPEAVRNDHPVLKRIQERAFKEVAGLRFAKDQFARLHDIAMDFAEEEPVLSLDDAVRVKELAEAEGAVAKVSSIHVNIWMGSYDKLSMTELFLKRRYGWDALHELDQLVFVGDSPNDEPMFARFPLSCAVANIQRYTALIKQLPAYVASKECGKGFAEIAHVLLEKRR